jgi:hypothetical protein
MFAVFMRRTSGSEVDSGRTKRTSFVDLAELVMQDCAGGGLRCRVMGFLGLDSGIARIRATPDAAEMNDGQWV